MSATAPMTFACPHGCGSGDLTWFRAHLKSCTRTQRETEAQRDARELHEAEDAATATTFTPYERSLLRTRGYEAATAAQAGRSRFQRAKDFRNDVRSAVHRFIGEGAPSLGWEG